MTPHYGPAIGETAIVLASGQLKSPREALLRAGYQEKDL